MERDDSDESREVELQLEEGDKDQSREAPEQFPNMQLRENNLTFEQTNLTMGHNEKVTLALMDGFFTDHLEVFCKELEIDRSKLMKPFSHYLSDSKQYFCYELPKPAMELYFTPKKVLIKEANFARTLSSKDPKKLPGRNSLLKNLHNYLYEKFPACGLEHYYEYKRPEQDRCFLFTPDPKQPFFLYHIKYLRADDIELHDSDFLVDKLFQFYLKVSTQLRTVSSFLMYWAFKRKILNPKFISQSAFKVLILAFLMGVIDNVGNVIHIYRNEFSGHIQSTKKCLKIGPGGDWMIDPLIEEFGNKCIIEYKKGFSTEEGIPIMHPKIYQIDFPIQPNEVQIIRDKFKEWEDLQTQSFKSDGRWVYLFFKYMAKMFETDRKIRVDLALQSGGQIFSQQEAPTSSFEIIHPIYRHNLTDNLKTEKTFQVVRQEFKRAFDIILDDDEEKIKSKLCSDFKQ